MKDFSGSSVPDDSSIACGPDREISDRLSICMTSTSPVIAGDDFVQAIVHSKASASEIGAGAV